MSFSIEDVARHEAKKRDEQPREKTSWKQDGNKASVEGIANKRISSLEDLIEFFHIDLHKWVIKAWECTSYESHTRMRHYDTAYKCQHGYARTDDEHKVVPLYRVSAKLEANRPLILLDEVKAEILSDLKKHSPRYHRLPAVKKSPASHLLEINIFDLHFGKLVWDQEAGENFDVKIAREVFLGALAGLLDHAKSFPVDRIVFPVGNDFFNVDTEANQTAKGTPQDEDTRWKKTFVLGRKLLVETIDRLRQIAPVDVPVIPGNHDATRAFFLGDALECWYHQCSNVSIDNGAKVRKYYRYGSNLIGYSHGKDERAEDLPQIMAQEVPALWADTRFREWHIGDKHHKKELSWQSTQEYKGVVVRYMRSLTSIDSWHHGKGFIGNLRAGEAFVWHKEHGQVCQFTVSV